MFYVGSYWGNAGFSLENGVVVLIILSNFHSELAELFKKKYDF